RRPRALRSFKYFRPRRNRRRTAITADVAVRDAPGDHVLEQEAARRKHTEGVVVAHDPVRGAPFVGQPQDRGHELSARTKRRSWTAPELWSRRLSRSSVGRPGT